MNEHATEGPDERTGDIHRVLPVPPHLSGMRLDQVAAALAADFSRSRLTQWIKRGWVRVNGEERRPRDVVAHGDCIVIQARLEPEVAMQPMAGALDVCYADEHLWVINKPPGLVVHPGAGNQDGTLQNMLLHHDPGLAQVPRAGIVHRLDKDTSGLLLVARTLGAHAALVQQLAARRIHRQYVALVQGCLVAGGTVDQPIGRDPRERVKRAVSASGKPAVTHYRVRERFAQHTLLQVELETGRTHQIRVHLAHIRHPIVGDSLYGALRLPKGSSPALREELQRFRRQALHAEQLRFAHPVHGREITVSAPLPADFERLLACLRQEGGAGAR